MIATQLSQLSLHLLLLSPSAPMELPPDGPGAQARPIVEGVEQPNWSVGVGIGALAFVRGGLAGGLGGLVSPFIYSISAERRVSGRWWLRLQGSGFVSSSKGQGLSNRARTIRGNFGARYAFVDTESIELSALADVFVGASDSKQGFEEGAPTAFQLNSLSYGADAGLAAAWKFHHAAQLRLASNVVRLHRFRATSIDTSSGVDVESYSQGLGYGFSLAPSLELRFVF